MVNVGEVNFHDLMLKIDLHTLTYYDFKAMDDAYINRDVAAFKKLTNTKLVEHPFFLTGDVSVPVLSIRNLRKERRSGFLAFALHSLDADMRGIAFVAFSVEPKATTTSLVFDPTHHTNEGFFEMSVIDSGDPDSFSAWNQGLFEGHTRNNPWPRYVLTTYTVKDRGVYEDEKQRNQAILDKLDKLPEVVTAQVNARVAEITSSPEFIAEVAKAQLDILNKEREKREKEQKGQKQPEQSQSPQGGPYN
ncbi:MAG: hypothetical protein ACLQEQ_03225 [Nitrososphaerales archaeon]